MICVNDETIAQNDYCDQQRNEWLYQPIGGSRYQWNDRGIASEGLRIQPCSQYDRRSTPRNNVATQIFGQLGNTVELHRPSTNANDTMWKVCWN